MLSSALRLAAGRGWLLLPDLDVPELVATRGQVLRFDARAPEPEIAARILQIIEKRTPEAPA